MTEYRIVRQRDGLFQVQFKNWLRWETKGYETTHNGSRVFSPHRFSTLEQAEQWVKDEASYLALRPKNKFKKEVVRQGGFEDGKFYSQDVYA